MKLRILFLIFLANAACTTLKPKHYNPPRNLSAQQQPLLEAECEQVGAQNQSTNGLQGLAGTLEYTASYDRAFDACMRSKGFVKK